MDKILYESLVAVISFLYDFWPLSLEMLNMLLMNTTMSHLPYTNLDILLLKLKKLKVNLNRSWIASSLL